MKILPTIAMTIVAIDCAGKAVGADPQLTFSENAVWLWWVAVVGWVIAIFRFLSE